MDARFAQRIEGIVTVASAAILAAAVAFALGRLSTSMVTAGAAAALVLLIAPLILRSIEAGDREFSLAHFAPAELVLEGPDELLLTDADRLDQGHSSAAAGELMLDDVLVSLADDSRVVRLFDASAMPTPGQLKAQIDRHLGQTQPATGLQDASAALHQALAELRHSLK